MGFLQFVLLGVSSERWGGVTFEAGSVKPGAWLQSSPPKSLKLYLNREDAPDPHAAWAHFDDTINKTGWSQLSVHSNHTYSDHDQMYAAGYVEGYLTQRRTWEFLTNNMGAKSYFHKEATDFLHNNTRWINEQVRAHPTDIYFHQVDLIYTQLSAAYDGYKAAAPAHEHVDFDTYYSATLLGDAHDLCVKYQCTKISMNDEGEGHCSVLIKPTPNNEDVIVGHTSWFSFNTMTRIYKLYHFPITKTGEKGSARVPGYRMSMPSYPGVMFSLDDFYQISSGMVVLETTIKNNNPDLWKWVKPDSTLEWVRNMVANRLADNGRDWVDWFTVWNSGTYNNQFMILDYKLFTPGQPLQSGFFRLMEQMPGRWVTQDLTSRLTKDGYWASYNRVYFEQMWNYTNQEALVQTGGDHFLWDKTSRAVIFREHQADVKDADSYRKLLRYNRFNTDAIGTQGCNGGARSASNAISARGDLTPRNADCLSQIAFANEVSSDGKFTTYKQMTQRVNPSDPKSELAFPVHAQSGPTYDDQPPFRWSTSPFKDVSHVGQPDLWHFPWVEIAWKN